MYQSFYNLLATPFDNTANPQLFYASEHHREALAAIEYTIRMRKGIVLITGPVGAGKTTVSRTMMQRSQQRATIVELLCGTGGGTELVRHLLRSLDGTLPPDNDMSAMFEALRAALLKRASSDRPVVLLVDEAQALSDEAIEQLRMLTNLDTATQKLLQLVLVGQPELRTRISQPNLSALRQRIVLARQLRALNVVQTWEYIDYRIKAVSVDPEHPGVCFKTEAVEAVQGFSGGLPRLINVVCDSALLLGFVQQQREITRDLICRVLDDMVPSLEPQASTETPLSLAGNF